MHLKNLLRKPIIKYTNKRKLVLKNAGVWGEKYINSVHVYVLSDTVTQSEYNQRFTMEK